MDLWRTLLVGDPHVTPSELEDSNGMLEAVKKAAQLHDVDSIIFLGDEYHTHSILHVEVVNFWIKAFEELTREYDIIAMVGNHDLPGNGRSDVHALAIHSGIVKVIDKPEVLEGILFLPYYADPKEFVKACREHNEQTTLICHQSFNGAKYENGFYAENGIDPDDIPQELVISGHIHAPQDFGKVEYPGAPRWRSLSDANTERNLVFVAFGEQGEIVERANFSMAGWCRQIFSYKVDPEHPLTATWSKGDDVRIDVRGPSTFVEEQKKLLAGSGAKVRTFKTDMALVKVKESEGIGNAFEKFIGAWVSKYGTPKEVLAQMAKERIRIAA